MNQDFSNLRISIKKKKPTRCRVYRSPWPLPTHGKVASVHANGQVKSLQGWSSNQDDLSVKTGP